MLSKQDFLVLLGLLDEDVALENVVSNFTRQYARHDHFKLGLGLSFLLLESLADTDKAFVASFVLFEVFKAQTLASHPFCPVFYHVVSSSIAPAVQRDFTARMVKGSIRDLGKLTGKELENGLNLNSPSNVDVEYLKQAFTTWTKEVKRVRNLHNWLTLKFMFRMNRGLMPCGYPQSSQLLMEGLLEPTSP